MNVLQSIKDKIFNLVPLLLYGKPTTCELVDRADRLVDGLTIGTVMMRLEIWQERYWRPAIESYCTSHWAKCQFQIIGSNLLLAPHIFNHEWELRFGNVGSIEELYKLAKEELGEWLPSDVAEPPEQAKAGLTPAYKIKPVLDENGQLKYLNTEVEEEEEPNGEQED